MIRFKCPICGKQLAVGEKFAGRDGNCSACQSKIQIPFDSEVTLDLPPSEESQPVVRFVPAPAVPQPEPKPAPKLKRQSTKELQGWLHTYAGINFIFSLFVLFAPLWLAFKFFTNAVKDVDGNPRAAFDVVAMTGGLVCAAVLTFLVLNVFTLACLWGESVLRLLERDD